MTKTDTTTADYCHTQKAPLCWILYGFALMTFVLVGTIGDMQGILIGGGAGLLLAALGPCFHHLTVENRGAILALRFGPVPVFRTTVKYADIRSAEIGRTLLLDGWGIHLSIRGGWVWNLWGRTCVVVRFKNGGTLRIGTDDADNLTRFLQSKVCA